jgi:hypothetical protein
LASQGPSASTPSGGAAELIVTCPGPVLKAPDAAQQLAADHRPWQLRGGVAAAESPPAGPSLGGSRSTERGCTGKAGRCSHPRRRFGFRRRRAPSVRRRRRGVCQCLSAQPCLDCSPTPAGQTLLGFAIPRRSGSRWSRRVGCRLPAPPLVSCWSIRLGAGAGAGAGAGWLGVARRAQPHRGLRVVGCRSGTPAEVVKPLANWLQAVGLPTQPRRTPRTPGRGWQGVPQAPSNGT